MATIDANIPLGVRQFDAPDQLNQLARIFQIQGLQKENQLGQLKMDEYQRSNQEMNALRSVLGQSGFSWENEANRNAAFGAAPLKAGELYEKYSKGREVQSKIKTEESKVLDEALARSRNALDTVVDAPGYIAWHEANHRDPVLGPWLASRGITPEASRAQIDAALSQPGGLEALIKRSALGMSKFTELNKPTTNVVNAGGTSQVLQTPGLGGPPQTVATIQHTQSPDSAATTKLGYAKLDEDKRHHGVTEKQQAEQVAQGAIEYKQDASGQWIALPKKVGAGPIQAQPVAGPGGQLLPTKNEISAKNALGIIGEAEKLLDGATGSYLGAGYDMAAQAFGHATNGSVATAKLKALEGALMMAQPRMEGPQSDKDVALYRQMAAQIGDPTVPVEAKKAALETVKALHQRYAPAATPPAAPPKPAGGPKVPRISGDAEYNALPSGATFIGPDGKTRRKP